MAQNGVSIVINGHDHDYQRWVPLDSNGNPSPSGITEFVAGGAGHGLQTFKTTDSRVAFSTDANPGAFGALKLTLNASGATFSYINTSGATINSGVIPCFKAGADTQAPSTPGSLSATATSSTRVDLSWLASSDNVGVSGYTVYRNGASLATVSGSALAYTDTTASPIQHLQLRSRCIRRGRQPFGPNFPGQCDHSSHAEQPDLRGCSGYLCECRLPNQQLWRGHYLASGCNTRFACLPAVQCAGFGRIDDQTCQPENLPE